MEQALMKIDPVERFHADGIRVLPVQDHPKETTGEFKRFMSIEETALETGLAVFFIRQGVRAGWIPHIKCGNKAMINIPKLIEILDEQSVNGNCR